MSLERVRDKDPNKSKNPEMGKSLQRKKRPVWLGLMVEDVHGKKS